MALNVNSGLVSVTGTVTSTSAIRTVTVASAVNNTTGATTLKTVAAGKKIRVISIALSIAQTANARNSTISLNGVGALTVATAGAGICQNVITFNYDAAPELTEGQTIVMTNSAPLEACAYSIAYVEESV